MHDDSLPIPLNYLNCPVCKKKYNKLGIHSLCYKKYCWICGIVFDTIALQQEHSKELHKLFYCENCKECINNLEGHHLNSKKWCKKSN